MDFIFGVWSSTTIVNSLGFQFEIMNIILELSLTQTYPNQMSST